MTKARPGGHSHDPGLEIMAVGHEPVVEEFCRILATVLRRSRDAGCANTSDEGAEFEEIKAGRATTVKTKEGANPQQARGTPQEVNDGRPVCLC